MLIGLEELKRKRYGSFQLSKDQIHWNTICVQGQVEKLATRDSCYRTQWKIYSQSGHIKYITAKKDRESKEKQAFGAKGVGGKVGPQ